MGSARFFLLELFTLALAAGLAASIPLPSRSTPPPGEVRLNAGEYIFNPADDPARSRAALRYGLTHGDLVVFGSSELTEMSDVALQRNVPGACGRRVITVGRAGFQSLPILLTLAGVRDALNEKSDVVVILSPAWFAERGTPSEAFLRFLAPREIGALVAGGAPESVRSALAREIRTHRDELTGLYPDWLYPSWPALARAISPEPVGEALTVVAEPAVKQPYDWNAVEARWRDEVAGRGASNPYGVAPEFWAKIQREKLPKPAKRLDPFRLELADLTTLSRFLRDHGVRARFIVQPIHRRVYRGLEPYDPLFAEVRRRLEADHHAYLSYFEEPFDPTTLRDVAHFSEAGWIRVTRELCR